MARVFNSNEANELIRAHELYQEKLQKLQSIKTNCIAEINKCNLSDHIRENADRELVNDAELSESSPVFPLIAALERYQHSIPIEKEADKLQKEYRSSVYYYINQVKQGRQLLNWLFSGGKKKAAVNEAYTKLKELLSSQYTNGIDALAAESEEQISDREILKEFRANPHTFRTLLYEAENNYFPRTSAPVCITEILDSYNHFQSQLNYSYEKEAGYRSNIKAAADKIRVEKLLDILKDASVEQLGHFVNGVRVKTLKDYGFQTMADIYCAGWGELASISGISDLKAEQIKKAADEFAQNVSKDIKIQINSDSRTPEAAGLLTALNTYISLRPLFQEITEFDPRSKTGVQKAVKNLESMSNSYEWLFCDDNEKASIRNSYSLVKTFLSTADIKSPVDRISDPVSLNESDVWEDFAKNSIIYFNILEEIVPGALGNDDTLYGLPEDLAREIQDECFFPDGLTCQLRKYQEWGVKYILHQGRVLLGDEMGLGKTIQAIAAMVSLRNIGATHFIVVCPASVLPNWVKEIKQKSKLRVIKIHGNDREACLNEWISSGGVAVTTYETTGYLKLKNDFSFDMLIVDEAHYIKNPQAKRTISLKELGLHAERMLFMTGTALENRVEEMVSLITILNPEVAEEIKNITSLSGASLFRLKVAPVYYRRKREDVLTELPELIESQEWCILTPEEEEKYEAALYSHNYTDIRRVSWNADDIASSSKAKRMMEIISEAGAEGRKIIVFSFYLETIRQISSLLGTKCMQPINGSIPVQRRQEILDEFEAAEPGTVLLAQIQSGGTGLNIQCASVVIFCEPQFKPSIENQAVSRAYRMGQSRNVLVYRLLCDDTIDERLMEVLAQKQAVFDAFADKSVAGEESLNVTEKAFGEIIEEEINRINAKKAEKE